MTISTKAGTLKTALNDAQPGQLPDEFRQMKLGDVVRALTTYLRGKLLDGNTGPGTAGVAGTNPYVLAAAHSLTLPDDAKCGNLISVYARAGTGTKGPLVIDNAGYDGFSGVEPVAGHVAVSPTGDLLFQHADAWTSLDIVYTPDKYDTVELNLPVVTNVLTLPTAPAFVGALFLEEVEALVGTTVGKKIVDVVGTAPAAAHAALDLVKLTVHFNAADAVKSARVKYGVYSHVDVDALLESLETGTVF